MNKAESKAGTHSAAAIRKMAPGAKYAAPSPIMIAVSALPVAE